MDIVEAIQDRRSIRAFKPDTVPQEILKEIMELALGLSGTLTASQQRDHYSYRG